MSEHVACVEVEFVFEYFPPHPDGVYIKGSQVEPRK